MLRGSKELPSVSRGTSLSATEHVAGYGIVAANPIVQQRVLIAILMQLPTPCRALGKSVNNVERNLPAVECERDGIRRQTCQCCAAIFSGFELHRTGLADYFQSHGLACGSFEVADRIE